MDLNEIVERLVEDAVNKAFEDEIDISSFLDGTSLKDLADEEVKRYVTEDLDWNDVVDRDDIAEGVNYWLNENESVVNSACDKWLKSNSLTCVVLDKFEEYKDEVEQLRSELDEMKRLRENDYKLINGLYDEYVKLLMKLNAKPWWKFWQ